MEEGSWHILLFCAAFGAFVITAAFHFAIYLQQKDKVFLSYALYLTLYAIFILVRILDGRLTDLFPLNYNTVYHLDELLAKLTLVQYVNFMGSLFVTPEMRFHLIGWRIMQWGTYSYCVIYTALVFGNVSIEALEPLSFFSSIFLLTLGFFLILKVFKFYRNPFYQLIIAGSLLLAFSTFSGVIYNIMTGADKLSMTAYSLMLTGGIPEIIFLSSALGFRLKQASREKTEAQQALIAQLQRNEQLAQQLNEELEEKVSLRTAEIHEKSLMLEQEREKKFLAEIDKQMAEAQLTALSAQMNPHFIFNCMNSIQKFILKNEKSKALDFLQHFSDLIRSVLDNSARTKVSLDEEIHMLEKYMTLEQQRLDQKFDFRIEIDSDLQTDFFEIPGMIIQPYVENAIWHGLMNKPEKGQLRLRFDRVNSSIRCVVEDDGVGRKLAAQLNPSQHLGRKGFGISIAQKRMELLQREHESIPEIRIEDLYQGSGQPAGTRVSMFFHIDS